MTTQTTPMITPDQIKQLRELTHRLQQETAHPAVTLSREELVELYRSLVDLAPNPALLLDGTGSVKNSYPLKKALQEQSETIAPPIIQRTVNGQPESDDSFIEHNQNFVSLARTAIAQAQADGKDTATCEAMKNCQHMSAYLRQLQQVMRLYDLAEAVNTATKNKQPQDVHASLIKNAQACIPQVPPSVPRDHDVSIKSNVLPAALQPTYNALHRVLYSTAQLGAQTSNVQKVLLLNTTLFPKAKASVQRQCVDFFQRHAANMANAWYQDSATTPTPELLAAQTFQAGYAAQWAVCARQVERLFETPQAVGDVTKAHVAGIGNASPVIPAGQGQSVARSPTPSAEMHR